MNPTVFWAGGYRFYFFSREELRVHVHIESPDGEAKFWLEPRIELAKSYRFREADLRQIEALIAEHEDEIRSAWHEHFGG